MASSTNNSADASTPKMKYRFLGNTGLLVSRLSYGTFVTFGTQMDFEKSYALFERAYKYGINFYDTAETYADGDAEVFLGKIVKTGIERGLWTREDLVLSTKIFFGTKLGKGGETNPNGIGLSRKHIVEGTKASLKRLGLDYVDLLFCHRPDPFTPIEETVRAMNYVIDQGWAFYWGTSEWTSAQVIEACEVADRLGLIRPAFDQTRYNMVDRSRVDYDFQNLYKKYGYGVTAFSALASGVLTGKYSKGVPEGSRLSLDSFKFLTATMDSTTAKALKLEVVAKKIGCTLPQLAIAWCLSNPNVSTLLLGASNLKQLEENVEAMAFESKITPEIRAEIDEIVDFKPVVVETQEIVFTMRKKFL